jgi:hypothetical protein
MTWSEALEIVVSRTGYERWRDLCSDDNPDVEQRDAYRALVIELATGAPSADSAAIRAYLEAHPCAGC